MKTSHTVFLILSFYCKFALGAVGDLGIYVYSEKGRDSEAKCQFSYESASSAAKAALRYNRINVVDAKASNMGLYLNVNTFETGAKSCALSIRLEFSQHGLLSVDNTSMKIYGHRVYCQKGATGYLDKNDLQSRVNQSLKEMVDECISEMQEVAK